MATLLGCNIGVELAQLATIGLIIPSLLLLGRSRTYPYIRIVGAGLALAASLGWL